MKEDFETVRDGIYMGGSFPRGLLDEPIAALDRIEAEVKRLRASRDAYDDEAGRHAEKRAELEAEVERLRRLYDAALGDCDKFYGENERLRAEQDNVGFIPWRLAQDSLDEYQAEVERLRAALERERALHDQHHASDLAWEPGHHDLGQGVDEDALRMAEARYREGGES
jgi:chromosome segregation ATPase